VFKDHEQHNTAMTFVVSFFFFVHSKEQQEN